MKSTKCLLSLLSVVSIVGLASCNNKSNTGNSTTGANNSTKADDTTKGNTDTTTKTNPADDTSEKVNLVISAYYDNAARKMKFVETDSYTLPYTSPNGTNYKAGDWKPVWKSIQKNLNMTITDASPEQDTSIKDYFAKTLTVQGFKVNDNEVNIAQGNSDQIIEEGTKKNDILDLKQYLDYMPNFKSFLDENPAVKKTISSADGKIYYAPYFDGYDDLERMIMVRQDWVEKLLDSDDDTGLDESVTLSKNYTPFYTTDINSSVTVLNDTQDGTTTITKNIKADKNIIAQMNSATTLNGKTAVKLLRQYIDDTYKDANGNKIYTKRSELFCGGKAVYDVDELIALFRCVKANPAFLTGNADCNMVAFFPRSQTSDRTTDLYRFLQFFGVRGVESRNEWMYVNNEGKLTDTRGTTEFRDGLKKLNEMYQDGLILENFTSGKVANSTDFRGKLYNGDYTQGYAGFATYDYNQTTTIYNDSSKDSKCVIASLLPATADFDDGKTGNFIHYTESWRSVKTQGWFITAQTAKDEKKLYRALKLFDYLYSDEGNRLMSYGPDEYLAKNDNGTVKTMDYQGKQVAVLSDDTIKQMSDLTGGNYTNFYRYYLGGTFPVGYIKEQGMEYQTVSKKAIPSLDVLNKAIQYGVLEHVNHKDNNASHMQDIVPTTLPFTSTENESLSKDFTDLKKVFTSNKKEVMYISNIVLSGFGNYGNFDFSYDNYCATVNNTLKLTQFTQYYNDAYARYKTL